MVGSSIQCIRQCSYKERSIRPYLSDLAIPAHLPPIIYPIPFSIPTLKSFFLVTVTILLYLKHAKHPGPLHCLPSLSGIGLSFLRYPHGWLPYFKPLLKISLNQKGLLNRPIWNTFLKVLLITLFHFPLLHLSLTQFQEAGRGAESSKFLIMTWSFW